MKRREKIYLTKKKAERKITNFLVEELRMSIDKDIMNKIIQLTEITWESIDEK
jgi:hypothetical protein